MLAAALRLHGIGFGLPALNDPDEPLFMMTAVEMIRNQSLNPGWFGHPGTITLYTIALVTLLVGGIGIATGRYADADALVGAVYADPGILFVPTRIAIALCGVLCVYLTWRLAKRVGGAGTGLLAAFFLAINALQIDYSQVIRTDVQASMFMLLCLLASLAIAERGRWRDYLLAGLFVGLGCATKWPAAAIALSPVAASLWRIAQGEREMRSLLAFAAAATATLVLASPYLLLDYPTVLRDLAGEARPLHPGATGGGPLANIGWYLGGPLIGAFGAAGLALAALGTGLLALRNRIAAVALLPGVATFGVLICIQALRWERWLVPLLPFVALALGYAVHQLAEMLRARSARPLRGIEPLAALLLALPMLQAAQHRAAERSNDTRQIAAAWLRAHAPPDSSILVEHAALDLVAGQWKLLFPLGSAGCVDARQVLARKIRYAEAEPLRAGRPVVDLGNVDMDRLPGCRARFAVLSHYDRYRDAPADYPAEWQRYAALTRGAVLRQVIAPVRGSSGGPTLHIFEIAKP
ncbi:glycosyltransferase family 39 protein [Sphingomonas sp. HF-S4]|uniref:Glycosyltransferase family 39 protein n=1 Tax=Sphingomonas agrestis TaxID=3080540 RepID=A0ABU3Y8Z1_9SPHN|nr:glycosyltransferase family 39 protein [Sphingomonas sp. HF-S4]MDV3457851.1 glycosyltransferase family 39 protein [Sphingomonas sp. HF-S4]